MPESYMVHLTLRALHDGEPAGRKFLREVAEEVFHWSIGPEERESQFPYYGEWENAELGAYTVTGEDDDALEWWEEEWSRPDPQGRSLDWLSQVRLATRGEEVECRIRVSARAHVGKISPEYASVRRPNIVGRLVTKFEASYFGDRVDAMPLPPVSARRIGNLVSRLNDASRRLPIVVISVSQETQQPLVSPKNAADRLAGLAEVVSLQDETAAEELIDHLGSTLSCYRGAVRLYWPEFDHRNNDPRSHRLWIAKEIERRGSDSVIDHIFNILCSRVARASSEIPLWKEVRDGISERAEERTRKRLQELGADRELLSVIDDALKEADGRRDAAIKRADDLENMLVSSEEKNASLSEELEVAQNNLRVTQEELQRAQNMIPKGEEREKQIRSVLDAVELAESLPNMVILDTAIDSSRSSQSNRGPDLYKIFCVLDELAVKYRGGLGMNVRDWLHDQLPYVRFDYSPGISDTAEGKWGQEYTYGGILMTKHLKFSGGHNSQNLLRVHFEFEFPDGPPRCVIGWAGDHQRNTQT